MPWAQPHCVQARSSETSPLDRNQPSSRRKPNSPRQDSCVRNGEPPAVTGATRHPPPGSGTFGVRNGEPPPVTTVTSSPATRHPLRAPLACATVRDPPSPASPRHPPPGSGTFGVRNGAGPAVTSVTSSPATRFGHLWRAQRCGTRRHQRHLVTRHPPPGSGIFGVRNGAGPAVTSVTSSPVTRHPPPATTAILDHGQLHIAIDYLYFQLTTHYSLRSRRNAKPCVIASLRHDQAVLSVGKSRRNEKPCVIAS